MKLPRRGDLLRRNHERTREMLITESWQNKEVLEMLRLEIMYFNFLRSMLVPIKLDCCDWILINMEAYTLGFQSFNKTSKIQKTHPHHNMTKNDSVKLRISLSKLEYESFSLYNILNYFSSASLEIRTENLSVASNIQHYSNNIWEINILGDFFIFGNMIK